MTQSVKPDPTVKAPAYPDVAAQPVNRPFVAGLVQAARRLEHLWVVGYFTIFSVVMTYPLVLRMRDAVVGEIGDNIYFIFLIRWYERAWFELGISPFFHPWLNYPQGWNLASTDTSLATTLFGLLASLFAGPTFGYNFAMLVTFVFSGWAMYYWVRRLTGSRAAGLVAGTIYAFLPYRMAHFLIGHLNLSGTQWFPLFFMGLYDLLRAPRDASLRSQWKPAVVAAISLGLLGLTSMTYLYLTLLIAAVFVVGYFWLSDRRGWLNPNLWLRLGMMGLISLPLVILSALPFLGLNSQGGLATRSVSYASMYSASPTDFILPSTDHFLWGQWVGANFDRSLWIEATLYIGAVSLVLAVIAWLHRSESQHAPLIKAGLVVIVVAFILALGTDFHWLGQRVEVTLPGFLQNILNREHIPIPLPALVLFRYLPFYAKMRALMRVGFFVLIFTTLLAGLGTDRLLRRVGTRRATGVTLLLLALIFVDFYPGPYTRFDVVAPRAVDHWLAAQPGEGAVAQFPFIQVEDQDQVYNTLTHGKPFIGGFFSANQPEQYLRIRPVLENFPSPEGAALLKELGVQWVLFDTRQYPDFPAVQAQVEALGLRFVTQVEEQAVFELDQP